MPSYKYGVVLTSTLVLNTEDTLMARHAYLDMDMCTFPVSLVVDGSDNFSFHSVQYHGRVFLHTAKIYNQSYLIR